MTLNLEHVNNLSHDGTTYHGRAIHLSRQFGEPDPIPPDAIGRLYDRYQNVYGQR